LWCELGEGEDVFAELAVEFFCVLAQALDQRNRVLVREHVGEEEAQQ
jgi:hypothetical protein